MQTAAPRHRTDHKSIDNPGRRGIRFEVNTEVGLPALRELAHAAWEWRESLHFRCGAIHFSPFVSLGDCSLSRKSVPGLEVAQERLRPFLIPPSWFVFGPPAVYASDSNSPRLDAARWLLD